MPSHAGLQLSTSSCRFDPPLQPFSHGDAAPPGLMPPAAAAERRQASIGGVAVGRMMKSGVFWMTRLNWALQSLSLHSIST